APALAGGRRWVTTRLAELSPAPAPVAADEDGSPYEVVAAFRSTASTVGFRLLTLLSAVPLTSQVIEYVRQEALPGAEPAHVSEILLSDLVDFAGDRFVFRDPRVRDVLRRRLEPAELAGLRLRAVRRTNTRRELFDHPDRDPPPIR